MGYELLVHPSAQKELDALPDRVADGLRKVLRALADSPRDTRFDLKPMVAVDDEPPALRLRVGEYRVILRVYHDLKEIRIARVGHRKVVYRGLRGLD